MTTHKSGAAPRTGGGHPETTTTSLERWAPLAGVLFALAFAVGTLASGDPPATGASGQEVIAHYDDTASVLASILAAPIAAVGLLVFAGTLRNRLRDAGAEWLATVAFAGAVVYAAGLGLFATTQLALLDAAELGQPEVAQALNILDNDNFMPVVIGMAVLLLATGSHTLTTRSLPTLIGWVTLLLGLMALAGPAGLIAYLLFPVWVLVVAVVMLRQRAATTQQKGSQ